MTDRDSLIELIYCAMRDYDDYVDNQHEMGMSVYEDFDEWLADELLAHSVIVPPCKVGDDVYYIIDEKIQALCVKYGTFVKNGLTMSAKCKDEADMCEAGCWLDGKTCGIGFDYSHIGYTVFLTKEEAEQKLKELNNNA